MKNLVLIFSIIIMAGGNLPALHAQTTNEAAGHMQEINSAFKGLKTNVWRYLRAVTRGKSARKVENKRKKLIDEIKDVKSEIKQVSSLRSDPSLKNAVLEYIDLTYTVMKMDYDKILDMEAIAEQSYDQMEAYMVAQQRAGEKLDEASEKYLAEQKTFAGKYNINLVDEEEDRKSEKIKQANEALKYYNQLYLVFFKCHHQESYVLDAVERNDVNALEQSASALASFAQEGKDKLKEIDSFNGDPNLKVAAREMMAFYLDESENVFPKMVDYYIKKDNFEKVRKRVESKSEKNRTQEDIDQYNNAVSEFNAVAEEFNSIGQKSYEDRSQKLDMWNEKVDDFFNKHSK